LGLVLGETEKPGGYGGSGDFDKHGVVEADLVKGVTDLEAALDFIGFHKRYEDCMYRQRLLAASQSFATKPVGHGQDGAEIVLI